MEFDFSHLRYRTRTVTAVSVLGLLVPFLAGLAIGVAVVAIIASLILGITGPRRWSSRPGHGGWSPGGWTSGGAKLAKESRTPKDV